MYIYLYLTNKCIVNEQGSTAILMVNIINVNDCPPEIKQESHSLSAIAKIKETSNAKEIQFAMIVTVHDPDDAHSKFR